MEFVTTLIFLATISKPLEGMGWGGTMLKGPGTRGLFGFLTNSIWTN